ncbi:MAG: DUF1223 domain-containing protein [Betaproteobacteria bacterium]|nr:DUF1223 domain-containing protein [Betaproteobacteria bacterium]
MGVTRALHLLAFALCAAVATAVRPGRSAARRAGSDAPLVELYTSEGCSSCPPADRWLSMALASGNDAGVAALAFHVDYWDRLGWPDRFARASGRRASRSSRAMPGPPSSLRRRSCCRAATSRRGAERKPLAPSRRRRRSPRGGHRDRRRPGAGGGSSRRQAFATRRNGAVRAWWSPTSTAGTSRRSGAGRTRG